MNDVLASRLVPRSLRVRGLRALGMALGEVRVGPSVTFSGTAVRIGDGTFINYGCFLDGAGGVVVGRDCDLGQRVSIHSVTHDIAVAGRRAGPQRKAETRIGDRVWLGAGSIVLPGVHVGDGCVIGAGAVVAKDCEPNCLYVGSPARFVRSLDVEPVSAS